MVLSCNRPEGRGGAGWCSVDALRGVVLWGSRPGGGGGGGVWGASRPPRARPGDRPGKGARPVHVNLLIAGAAGLLGFFSPCVLPLIPGYISFVSGVSLAELQG